MDESILRIAAQRYGIAETALIPMLGGHFSHVYAFTLNNRLCVLRITPPNDDVDAAAMAATLDWVHFLATRGAAVVAPLPSAQGRLIEPVDGEDGRYLFTAFERAPGVRAETLPVHQWSEALYARIGRTVGRLHALSATYVPPAHIPRRPAWDESVNCFNPMPPLDASQLAALERQAEVMAHIRTLPKHTSNYGLAHLDLHFGNFFVDVTGDAITLFDFDDCAYGWYAMDIAMALFDILVLYPGADKADFATKFLASYLEGYMAEKAVDAFWIRQLPHFLKLLEIGVYAQLYRYYDPEDTDPWVRAFMPGRKSRIEFATPYVDLDIEAILRTTAD